MNEILTIIFSKNRAQQLKAAIDSFYLYCEDVAAVDIKVLYKTFDSKHEAQYEKLTKNYEDIEFLPESDFSNQVKQLLSKYSFVLFLVDDNIFVKNFNLILSIEVLKKGDFVLGISLRLGQNTTYHYMLNKNQKLPFFKKIINDLYVYEWTKAEYDFGYPLEVSSSIYRTKDVLQILENVDFSNPNSLEDVLNNSKNLFANTKPILGCFKQSVAFCNPVNLVQTYSEVNRNSGKQEYSVEELSEKFDKGEFIDIKKFHGFVPNAAHQDVELCFYNEGSPEEVFISVIIPCYNQAHFLQEAVESIVNQSYKNFEIIIVNDGSPDNTSEVANNLIKKYPYCAIRLLEKENEGLAEARNFGIKTSKGNWILPLDSDDIIVSTFLENALEIIKKSSLVNLVFSNMQEFGYRNGEWIPGEYSKKVILEWNVFPYCSLFKRELFFATNGYYKGIPWGAEDWNFWLDLSRIGLVPKRISQKLFLYRTTGCSMYDKMMPHFDEVKAFIVTLHPDLYGTEKTLNACSQIQRMSSETYEKLNKIIEVHPHLSMPSIWKGIYNLELNEKIAINCFEKALKIAETNNDNLPRIVLFNILKIDRKISKLKSYFEYWKQLQKENWLFEEKNNKSESESILQSTSDLIYVKHEKNRRDKKKILLTCDYFWPSIGGVEIYIEELGYQLQKSGYEVMVACHYRPERKSLSHYGMTIYEFDFVTAKRNKNEKIEIEKYLDLVLTKGFDYIIALSQPDNWIGKCLQSLPINRPGIILLPSISKYNLSEWADNGLGIKVLELLKNVDHVITVSENGYDVSFLSAQKIASTFIPHSYDKIEEHFNFRERYLLDKNLPMLIMVANFWPVKNHDGLLEVLKSFPGNWQLVIIGNRIDIESDYYNRVQSLADNDKRVKIIGGLPKDLAASAIKEADILLLPSKAESAGPLVVLQAMSYGIPWIATPSCNSVNDEAGGIVCPVEKFPVAIEFILRNSEIRNNLSALGREHWKHAFKWDKAINIFTALIEGRISKDNLGMTESSREKTKNIQNRFEKFMSLNDFEPDLVFSVIVPTYNRVAVLSKCLKALELQTFPLNKFEVFVCDDGSTDGTEELVKNLTLPYSLTYLKQKNKGPAAARNLGIKKAKGNYLLIINDDAILEKNVLQKHYDIHSKRKGEKISILGNFKLLPEYSDSLIGKMINTSDILFNYPKMISGLLYDYNHFYTCNISILKKAVLDIGLFDEIFDGPAAEDIELGYRLYKQGYRVLFDDSIIAWHDHPVTIDSYCKVHFTRGYGAVTLSYKHPEAFNLNYFDGSFRIQLENELETSKDKTEKAIKKLKNIDAQWKFSNQDHLKNELLVVARYLHYYYSKRGMLANKLIEKIVQRNSMPFHKPLVSIIVPCYNYAKYLPEAVESVINQTFKDFEIIIVNDGSKDNSKEVAEDLVIKYRNEIHIKLINQPNSGQPAISRNNGIKESKGDYILCLDADDKIAPTMLEKSLSVLEALPDLGVVYTHRQDFDGTDQLVKASEYNFELLKRQNILSVCSLFRKKAWDEVGGYRTNVKGLEDWDFWIALGAKGYFGKLIPEPLFFYRRHDTGVFQEALKGEKKKFAQIILNNKSVYSSKDVEAAERFLQMTEKEEIDFSVIIPTFNRKDKLKKSIESVLGSSCINFEIIIVNDAGDDVKDIVKNFNDSRIKYLEHKTNKGLAASRNTGIKEANGKYIALLDDDDIFYPDHLKIAFENLNNNNKVVYTDAVRLSHKKENGNFKLVNKSVPYSIDYSRDKLLIGNIAPVNCFVFEKSLVEKAGMFDETLPVLEDWDFWLRLSSVSDFKHIKEVTVQVNWYDDGSTLTSSKGKRL